MSSDCGKALRLGRIISPKSKRAVCVAFDHGLDIGPMPGIVDARAAMQKLVDGGADAVLVSPGIARLCADLFAGKDAPSLILRLDWTNIWRPIEQLSYEEGRTRMIATVEDAMRLGADAVLSFMFVGYNDPDVEAEEVAKNGVISRECEAVGMPHFIEPMARGRKIAARAMEDEIIAFHVRMAAELGADAIKTDYSGSPEKYRAVTEACHVPILIAGGPKTNSVKEGLEMVEGAMRAGAAGTLLGRNILQAEDPARMLQAMRGIVHGGQSVDQAMAEHLSTPMPEQRRVAARA